MLHGNLAAFAFLPESVTLMATAMTSCRACILCICAWVSKCHEPQLVPEIGDISSYHAVHIVVVSYDTAPPILMPTVVGNLIGLEPDDVG